jgi:HTH-type transcriptional regulator, sugar sensing transcriptional regulator
MDTSILENIGLTPGEIKVYLSLLELGPSSAGNILENAGIQNSVFHFCVNKLIEKGLVSYVKSGKIRIYKASDPENFLIYLKDKEKKIKEILPELKERQVNFKEKLKAEVFEGISGIINLLNISIEGAKKGDEYLFFSIDAGTKNEEIQDFYKIFDLKRKEKGLITKGIANSKLKPLFIERTYLKMKYTHLPIPYNIGICNDKMVLTSWDEKPSGVLIQAKNLVKNQRDFFNELWRQIK